MAEHSARPKYISIVRVLYTLLFIGALLASFALISNQMRDAVDFEYDLNHRDSPPDDINAVWTFFSQIENVSIHDPSNRYVQALKRFAYADSDPQLLVDIGEELMVLPEQRQDAENYFYLALDRIYAKGELPTCPHQGLGTLMFRNGDYDQAIEHWETYLTNAAATDVEDDNTGITRWSLIRLLIRLDLPQQALRHLPTAALLAQSHNDRLCAGLLWACATLQASMTPD
ncbi:MAG: hypothetical protein P9M14_13935 [Candidatus Alcyoniella australis]|nr:hypothetical protein [Candidatus Alcyoniella australis]